MKVRKFYQCARRHQVDHGISRINSSDLICPSCSENLLFQVTEKEDRTEFRLLDPIREHPNWWDVTSINLKNSSSRLSLFDTPIKVQKIEKENLLEYRFRYDRLQEPADSYKKFDDFDGKVVKGFPYPIWHFQISDKTEIGLWQYKWQIKELEKRSSFWKRLFSRGGCLVPEGVRQPIETNIAIVKGENKEELLLACKTIMLLSNKLTTRLNAQLCHWLITFLQ